LIRASSLSAFALVAVVASSVAAPATAQPSCADPEQPAVTITFVGEAWTDEFRAAVSQELAVALLSQEIQTCSVESLGGREPTANLELRAETALPRVSVTIEVDDRVTRKRVARDIDLSAFTEDSRALALAVASDELLRASWIELALADAPEPAQPPPRQVQRVVDREIADAGPPLTTLGLRFATSYFSEGELLVGGDLWIGRQLSALVSLELSLGARRGVTTETDNGTVESTALGGALDVFIHPVRGDVLTVGGLVGVWVAQVTYEGVAGAGGIGRTEWGIAATARAAGLLEVQLAPIVFRITAGVGAPLSQVIATTDAGEKISGVGGIEVSGTLGVGVRF